MGAANRMSSLSSNESNHASRLPAKRKRYTPVACGECKRRKVKCDGKAPCEHCTRVSTDCVYVQQNNAVELQQESEWKKMNAKIEKLQEQISLLVSNAVSTVTLAQTPAPITPMSISRTGGTGCPVHVIHTEPDRSCNPSQDLRRDRYPQYMGPTSPAFTLGMANSSLRQRGVPPGTDPVDSAEEDEVTVSARGSHTHYDARDRRDPLLAISQSEAIRLIAIYEEECGLIYSFLDNELLLKSARDFYNNSDSGRGQLIPKQPTNENMLSGGIIDILKLVIAIALVIENNGPTILSAQLLNSVESGFDGRLCGASVKMLEIQAWTAMSILQFHCDEEVLAWRTIGLAARAVLEMGLHHREAYLTNFQTRQQRFWANRLFWCIYVLYRRWGFGTGLPFAINDSDIDPDLPEPNDTNSYLLKIMIAYGHVGSKVWKAATNLKVPITAEETAFLSFQVQQWRDSIIPELQLQPQNKNMLEGHSRTKNRLRVLLYLSADQMRLLIFRRSLLSSKTIAEDFMKAQQAADIAKDTIHVLDKLNKLSDIYSSQQTCFNYFLVSALAVLFLAACHHTARFSETCREEFFMALELVRGFSGSSYVSLKLWKYIKHLKVVGAKLGIFPGRNQDSRQRNEYRTSTTIVQSSASGQSSLPQEHELNQHYFDAWLTDPSFYDDQLDGVQLSNELTSLFETMDPVFEEYQTQLADQDRGFDLYGDVTTEHLSRSLLDLV